MLLNIPKILSPELVKALCEMGHGDKILLADANFPGKSAAERCHATFLRADGIGPVLARGVWLLAGAVAIVVALKGVGRFTELATPAARERFIVGTMASLLWACAVSAIVPLALW